MSDLQLMGVITLTSAVLIGALGLCLVMWARRQSLVAALVVAALVPFGAVVAAVAVNVNAMFLSSHDADVIWFVLAVTSVLAAALAIILGRSLGRELRRVGDDARRLAEDGPEGTSSDGNAPAAPVTAELAHLSAELADTRARLAVARERERAAEGARRQVVAFVSHDLRSPLAGIHAASQGLRDEVFDDPGTALDGIESAVQRMARMIDDLAELSRPGSDDVPAPGTAHTRVDLAAVVRDVVAHVLPVATEAGVVLDSKVEDGVAVTGDSDDLARLLDNLVANAVRASGTGGRVLVAAQNSDGGVRLVVEDTCGGIAEHDRRRVLEPGFQGDGAVGASGLGLAIVDSVVEAHGGNVAVGSTGDGCSVEVRIPVA